MAAMSTLNTELTIRPRRTRNQPERYGLYQSLVDAQIEPTLDEAEAHGDTSIQSTSEVVTRRIAKPRKSRGKLSEESKLVSEATSTKTSNAHQTSFETTNTTTTPSHDASTADGAELAHPSNLPSGTSARRGRKPSPAAGRASGGRLYQAKKRGPETDAEDRPAPADKPRVWAESRQDLCETIHRYQAYNSAAHHRDGVVYGMMVNDLSTRGLYMDKEIIITRASGKCTLVNGTMQQTMDHRMDSADVKCFQNAMERQDPILMIVGRDHSVCPVQPPHLYNVMEYFHVTDIWFEQGDFAKTIKYRLEKVRLNEQSWWDVKDSPPPPSDEERDWTVKAPSQTCLNCCYPSKRIFKHGWICLNGNCGKFWTDNGKAPPSILEYNPLFLAERTPFTGTLPTDWDPQCPPQPGTGAASVEYSRAAWKGVVCPECGQCNSRTRWQEWHCQNVSCPWVLPDNQRILTRADVDGQAESDDIAPSANVTTLPNASFHDFSIGNWGASVYQLSPGNTIHHFRANRFTNCEPGGADDLFRALQAGRGCGLIRGELKNLAGVGRVLTQHFTHNYGMPYKYVVRGASSSFADAPQPILQAMTRLTWAGKKSAQQQLPLQEQEATPFLEFNENLVVGYFEKGKMSYHDDGEKELGPTIATLSLGAPGDMYLRLKSKYFRGFIGADCTKYNPDWPVLPGAYLEQERLALHARRPNLSDEQFKQEVAKMFAKTRRTIPKTAPDMVHLKLRHGDMIVMNGYEMQKYYEHAIIPSGKLRFALTARHIKPAMVPQAEHYRMAYDHSRVTDYHGYETQGPARGRDPAILNQNPLLRADLIRTFGP